MGYKKIMAKDAVTELLDDIERILKRDGETLGDLARNIGRSYHQTYLWVRARRFNPRAEALMTLQNWRDRHKFQRGVKASKLLASTRRGTEE